MAFSLKLNQYERTIVALWGIVRILTIGWALYVARLVPLDLREITPPAYTIAEAQAAGIHEGMLSAFLRRDTLYYYTIIERGYQRDDGSAQFHPLLAWLSVPVAWLSGDPMIGLMFISSLTSLGLFIVFSRLVRLTYDDATAQRSGLLLLFSPLAFVLFIPYTEGLFLLCTALCLLWMRQGRWWLAGMAGGLAVLTRQQGLFLALPMLIELVVAWRTPQRNQRVRLHDWLAIGLIPLGLMVWIIYRAIALQDVQPDWSHPQSLIYSLLISPSSGKVVPHQAFLMPWDALGRALEIYWRTRNYSLMFDFVLGVGFLCLVAVTWRGMRLSEQLFTLTIIVVSFGYYTGPFFPYMGLPRHLLLALPVFVHLGAFFQQQRAVALLVGIGILTTFFLQLQYGIHGWVP